MDDRTYRRQEWMFGHVFYGKVLAARAAQRQPFLTAGPNVCRLGATGNLAEQGKQLWNR